jgi:uncharacterized protein YPO0396
VCGGAVTGTTRTSGKGYKTRYYFCNNRHRGDHDSCPKYYSVPADKVENHVLALVRDTLRNLAENSKLQQYVEEEFAKLEGCNQDASRELQKRLSQVDQKIAQLRDHLTAVDHQTAETMGLYSQAQDLTKEKGCLEAKLGTLSLPKLPTAAQIASTAANALRRLEKTLVEGTIEEKRYLISLYVKTIKADPNSKTVQIGLFAPLFTAVIAGTGFEPATSGL